jgi:hypothetical protein
LLVLFLLLADAAVLGGGVPFERYALGVALNPSSSAMLIGLLLLANLGLLALTLCALSASVVLLDRVRRRIFRKGGA